MKRVTLVLAGLLCAATLTAQARPPRTQTGNATQEMQTPGLSAAHNNLPIGSKAKIRSLSNGREIEVTITEQIPTSTRRIIDLSPSAALALELGFGGPVIVTPLLNSLSSQPSSPLSQEPQQITPSLPPPQQPQQIIPSLPPPQEPQQITPFLPPPPQQIPDLAEIEPEPEFLFEPVPAPEPVVAMIPEPPLPPPPPQQPLEWDIEPEPAKTSKPYTIIINNYIVSPEDWQRLQKSGALTLDSDGATPGGETPYPAAQPHTGPGSPPVSYSMFTAPPVGNIRVIPALPSPHSGKTYRLLVGTYPSLDGAFNVYRQLKAAGFEAVQEQSGTMCRVFAVGIPAPSVYHAAQRLGAIGFEQIWIHE